MPPRIISISRRTDIPAFYGDWFLRRLDAGIVGWENPFGGRPQLVSLRRDDVRCLAFWSKNFRLFLPHLRTLQARGYPCFFNYTITGLPSIFEPRVVPMEDAVDSLRELASRFSPEHIQWRYDPIILSELTLAESHLDRFAALAAALRGSVRRCIVSFAWRYRKVECNLAALERATGVRIVDPDLPARRKLAEQLAGIAEAHGMTLHACCCNNLLGGRVHRAHCIDGEAIARLYSGASCRTPRHPNRPECGCADSVDIGRYETCLHGCVYCYANADPARAAAAVHAHDPNSLFLGRTREESKQLLQECRGALDTEGAEGEMRAQRLL